jgi:hypothetical protein
MTVVRPSFVRPLATLLLATSLIACGDDGVSPGDANNGTLQLRLSQSVSAASVLPDIQVAQGNVVRSDISEVRVSLTEVSALRVGANENDEASWVRFPIVPAASLDLMNLPTSAQTPLVLPVGDLPAGTYQNLRLHVTNPTITFSQQVEVGQRTWAAGQAHPLRIPGSDATAIKIPTASFVVLNNDASEIDLVLQVGTSVQTIAATPNFILMAPVLQANNRR